MKKIVVASAVVTASGALTAIAFAIAAGVDYRLQEDQGLEPGYTPPSIVNGIEFGMWIFAIGAAAIIVSSIVLFNRRRAARSRTT
jgi:hypothetical protein